MPPLIRSPSPYPNFTIDNRAISVPPPRPCHPKPYLPTISRKGFQEERDGTRLRDGRSKPVACYVCGGSSIPLNSHTTDPESTWRQIVSCDYCALHWHLDCLSPPLASMPNSGRKWMCPNHADQVMVCCIFTFHSVLDLMSRLVAGQSGRVWRLWTLNREEQRTTETLSWYRMKTIGHLSSTKISSSIAKSTEFRRRSLGLISGTSWVSARGKSYLAPCREYSSRNSKRVAPAKGGDGVFKHKRSNSASSETSLPTDPPELDVGRCFTDLGCADVKFEPTADDLHAAHLVLALTQPLVEEPNTQHTPSTSIIPAAGTAAPSSDQMEMYGPTSRTETVDTSSTNTLNGVVDADMVTTPPTGSPAPRRDTGTPKITLRLGRRNE